MNNPVNVAELPVLVDAAFVPVHPNYLRVSLVGIGLAAVAVVVAGAVTASLVPRRGWIPVLVTAGLLVLLAASAVLKILAVRYMAYQVRDHDLSFRQGVVVKRVSTVPFVRVQHARVRSGPVQRRFGLATLEVNSAGPDLRIEGLASDEAERLKALVVERAGDLIEEP